MVQSRAIVGICWVLVASSTCLNTRADSTTARTQKNDHESKTKRKRRSQQQKHLRTRQLSGQVVSSAVGQLHTTSPSGPPPPRPAPPTSTPTQQQQQLQQNTVPVTVSVFECIPPDVLRLCTAVNLLDWDHECTEDEGEPCANGIMDENGVPIEHCCVDFCGRKYCTAKGNNRVFFSEEEDDDGFVYDNDDIGDIGIGDGDDNNGMTEIGLEEPGENMHEIIEMELETVTNVPTSSMTTSSLPTSSVPTSSPVEETFFVPLPMDNLI